MVSNLNKDSRDRGRRIATERALGWPRGIRNPEKASAEFKRRIGDRKFGSMRFAKAVHFHGESVFCG